MGLSKQWLRGATLAAAIGVMAACSPAGAPSGGAAQPAAGGAPTAQPAGSGQQPGGAPAAAGTPKYGGTLRIGMRDTPENMNFYAGVFSSQITFQHFYEPLVAFDQKVDYRIDFPMVPWLAESWETPDPKTWVFKIRDGVKWHDGTPLTAEAVAWSFDYLRHPDNKFPGRTSVSTVEKVSVEPGNKVKLALRGPTPNFLANVEAVKVLPKHVFDAGGLTALETKSAGTGPFALESFDRTSRTAFKKFGGYWGKDDAGRQLPFLDGLWYTHNMDMSSQQAAVAAGQIDVFNFSDKAQLDAFQRRVKDMKVVKFQYSGDAAMPVNLARPHLNKLEVRKALHLLINRQELNENFAAGEGMMGQPVIPAMKTGWAIPQDEFLKRPGIRPSKAEDLAEAKRLLEQTGVPKDWEIVVVTEQSLSNAPQAEMVVNQFNRAGLKARWVPMDAATTVKEERAGNYDLSLRIQVNADVTRAYNFFHSKGGANIQRLSDPDVDAVAEKLQNAVEPAEQKRLARQFEELILDRYYALTLVTPAIYTVFQPWVNEWRTNTAIQVYANTNAPYIWIDTDRLPTNRK